MHIAVVQFAPKIGKVQDNIDRAYQLCERLQPNTVDLVCLPEMIFTGYVFPDAAAISPFLEEPLVGPTSRFCASLAARLRCYVVAGYPERLSTHELGIGLGPRTCPTTIPATASESDGSEIRTAAATAVDPVVPVGANSAALYGPEGEFVGHYRKTNLYETDMTWARAGTGFTTFHLPPPLNTVSLAICMDLNAQPGNFWAYEVAEYCIAQKTNLLVLLNAWLDSQVDLEATTDWSTIRYWAMRLSPLWSKVAAEDDRDSDSAESDRSPAREPHFEGRKPGDEIVVVVCNRCGVENGITFAGSSSLFSLTHGTGRPRVLHAMGRRQEGVEVWTYPDSPDVQAPGPQGATSIVADGIRTEDTI